MTSTLIIFQNKSLKLWQGKSLYAFLQWCLALNDNSLCLNTFIYLFLLLQIQCIHFPMIKNTAWNVLGCSVELHIRNAVCWGRWDQHGEVGAIQAARAARSKTTQGGVRSLAGVQGSWLAAHARGWGSRRHSEALPEWTEIFSSAHKGHFSLPQQNHSDRKYMCVCVPVHVGRAELRIFLEPTFPRILKNSHMEILRLNQKMFIH